ncbi:hypothetical protein AB0K89_13755 [Streptomyces cinnamoneus]
MAAQDAGEVPRWQVVVAEKAGCPQQAREGLHWLWWFWGEA